MANAGNLYQWVEALPEHGRYSFSRAELSTVTDASSDAVRQTLQRLKRRDAIIAPRRGFYVVVPREYRTAGSPPASWFIDDLMRHQGRRYYVALLTAAALHGAGHQQPMAFQVIAEAAERDIEVGRVRIGFHRSRSVDAVATQRMQTETGMMTVATPETTAVDIVRFPRVCGYWNNVATVLAELMEQLEPQKLGEAARHVATSDAQRLGWLLDQLQAPQLARAVADALAGTRLHPTPLTPGRDTGRARLDADWKILVTDQVEPDL